ncbi:platelet-derived growth factor receptor beta-like [Acanthaster planci]|uniref:receptor protein-tyrosine kinase n=1 Tax=Acanthaster planci TaxID=133434 RepID=A0A8B7ZX93_ACAPL|nr:platelet-derived growth factor receptor beta-like [Acanthaster planci]
MQSWSDPLTLPVSNGGISTLRLSNITRFQAGNYTCSSSNGVSTTHGKFPNVALIVHYAPTFLSVQRFPDSPIVEDTEVVLTCIVDAKPLPVVVTWEKQDSSYAMTSLVNNDGISTLTLSNITRDQSGYYTCPANNAFRQMPQVPIECRPWYVAGISNKDSNDVHVRSGEDATFICTAAGNPKPALEWYNPNGTRLTNSLRSVTIVESAASGDDVVGYVVRSVLVVHRVNSRADCGIYICVASNGVGERDSMAASLLEARRPGKPTVLAVGRTVDTLTVTWIAGHDGGKYQWFEVTYRETSDATGREVSEGDVPGLTNIYTVKGLEPYTEYEIRVYARNEVGRSPKPGRVVGFTLPQPPTSAAGFVLDSAAGTLSVRGFKGGADECLRLEAKTKDNGNWSDCGGCARTDTQILLSVWCKTNQESDSSIKEFTEVRSRICHGEVCSEPIRAEGVNDLPRGKPPLGTSGKLNIGVILTIAVAALLLVVVLMLSAVAWKKFKEHTKGETQVREKDAENESLNSMWQCSYGGKQGKEITDLTASRQPEPMHEYANVPTVHRAFPRDKLQIVKELGHGAFGLVLLAEAMGITEESKTTLVAIKTLKRGAVDSDRTSLIKELDLMKKIPEHTNVVKLLGYCVEQDPPYIIVEYLSLGNLKDLLDSSRTKDGREYGNLHGVSRSLTAKDLIKFAKDVADGMAFIASQQCVHRDLAARNVLVAEDMTCKVSDFGLARDVMNIRTYKRGSGVMLPVRWMALESLLDDEYTTMSDVWSFGILLWEIVTLGARPYPRMDNISVMYKLQSGYRMPKPKYCQEDLYFLMLQCWEENPLHRPTFAAISEELQMLTKEGRGCDSIEESSTDDIKSEDDEDRF